MIAGDGDEKGPPEPTPTATAVERAQAVRACERLHGMTRAQDKRATRAERHGSAFDAKATRFRSCAWPPPPGAEPGAYRDDLAPDEAVVRHSSGEVVRGVRCLEAGS